MQKEKIIQHTKQGLTAHSIRLREKLTCTKDVLYEVRRPILNTQKMCEMDSFLNEIQSWNNWSHEILRDKNNKFCGCHMLHNRVCKKSYSNDVCIVDDTSCTNYYGLPILVMIVEDENGKNQLLAFSIIENRQEYVFEQFFNYMKSIVGEINCFVCDRNPT